MKKLVIGVDIGGINTVLGLVDRTGEVYARSSFRTAEYPFFDDYSAYVEMLVRTLRELCAAMPAGAVLSGIGIGAPNANYHTGRIERPVNLWKFRSGEPNPEEGRRFFSLCKEVGNSFPGIPVRITNDANAAALGEIAYGNAGGMRDFIMVTLGTGLGSGFVAGGRMIYGHDGMAGELGHVVVEPGGRQCGCGRRGCLETYCSANSLEQASGMTIKEFFPLLREKKSPQLIQIWEDYLKHLAFAMKNLNLVIDAPIIISGYLAPYFTEEDTDYLLEQINSMTPFELEKEQLLVGTHGQYTPAIGAALFYVKEFIHSV